MILRPMALADLDQVEEIEQESFPTPWPKNAFHYELTRNPHALCRVAEWIEPDQPAVVVADIVIWLVVDEAHIGTLAVRPGYRGRGIGKRLLALALLESARGGATRALLEVRASNQVAQNLYLKFGFEQVGIRAGYYADTQEDALLLTLPALDVDRLAEMAQPG